MIQFKAYQVDEQHYRTSIANYFLVLLENLNASYTKGTPPHSYRLSVPVSIYKSSVEKDGDPDLSKAKKEALKLVAYQISEFVKILRSPEDPGVVDGSYVVGEWGENIIWISSMGWDDPSHREVVCFVLFSSYEEYISTVEFKVCCGLANVTGGFLQDLPDSWTPLHMNISSDPTEPTAKDQEIHVDLIRAVQEFINE